MSDVDFFSQQAIERTVRVAWRALRAAGAAFESADGQCITVGKTTGARRLAAMVQHETDTWGVLVVWSSRDGAQGFAQRALLAELAEGLGAVLKTRRELHLTQRALGARTAQLSSVLDAQRIGSPIGSQPAMVPPQTHRLATPLAKLHSL
ncbi:MAG: hypothetical protein KTR31_28665 [Myxococcales bacterium]|nr:hypothetical protein [Myxococcales bacterium]